MISLDDEWDEVESYYNKNCTKSTDPFWSALSLEDQQRWRDQYREAKIQKSITEVNDEIDEAKIRLEARAAQVEAVEWTKVQEYYRTRIPSGKWSLVKKPSRIWWRENYRASVAAKNNQQFAEMVEEGRQKQWNAISDQDRHATLRYHVETTGRYNFHSLPLEEKLAWWNGFQNLAGVNPTRHFYIRNFDGLGGYTPWKQVGDKDKIIWRGKYTKSVPANPGIRDDLNWWPSTDYKLTDGLISSSPEECGYLWASDRPEGGNFFCTSPVGHDGGHVAESSPGHIVARYPVSQKFSDEEMDEMIKQLNPQHEQFPGGGMREPQGDRPRFELLYPKDVPFDEQLLTRCAVHMAKGAEKYADRNWEKFSDPASLERAKSSAMRHLVQWMTGDTDEDHAAAVVFNLMAAELIKGKIAKRPW